MRTVRHVVDVGTRVLQAMNPTAVLGRGFSLTWTGDDDDRRLARNGSELAPGTILRTTLANGADVLSEVRGAVDRSLRPG